MLRTKRIAIVSQTKYLRTLAEAAFVSEGHNLQSFDSVKECATASKELDFDAVILDVSSRPPRDISSFTSLVEVVGKDRIWIGLPMGQSPWANDAEKLGVWQTLRVPIQRSDLEDLMMQLNGAPERPHLSVERTAGTPSAPFHIEELPNNRYFLAASPAMMRIYDNVRLLAAVDAPVLILGESGVGKDVIANLLHKHSHRSAHPFSSVNCAALPPDLLESELFGYEAGAFTGAVKAKPGKFELADKGTILLDEIGEMSAPMQAKLLHVLQDGRYSRLGARTASVADVRVIAATNVDIENAIADKVFREDLYYRISTFTLRVPPLRERREEIPYLVEEMLKRQAATFRQDPVYVSPQTMALLQEYNWPGNLRELSNAVIRMQVLKGHESSLAEIESKVLGKSTAIQSCTAESPVAEASVNEMRSIVRNFKDQTESRLIQQALEAARWNRRQAAVALRISYRTLLYKIDQYHLKETRIPLRFTGMNGQGPSLPA